MAAGTLESPTRARSSVGERSLQVLSSLYQDKGSRDMSKRGSRVVVLGIGRVGHRGRPACTATRTDKKQNKAIKELESGLDELEAALDSGINRLQPRWRRSTTSSRATSMHRIRRGPAVASTEGDGLEANDTLRVVAHDRRHPHDGNQATVPERLFFAVPDGTTSKPTRSRAGSDRVRSTAPGSTTRLEKLGRGWRSKCG